MQNANVLDKNQQHQARVAANINLTQNIKYPVSKPTYILIKKLLPPILRIHLGPYRAVPHIPGPSGPSGLVAPRAARS